MFLTLRKNKLKHNKNHSDHNKNPNPILNHKANKKSQELQSPNKNTSRKRSKKNRHEINIREALTSFLFVVSVYAYHLIIKCGAGLRNPTYSVAPSCRFPHSGPKLPTSRFGLFPEGTCRRQDSNLHFLYSVLSVEAISELHQQQEAGDRHIQNLSQAPEVSSAPPL